MKTYFEVDVFPVCFLSTVICSLVTFVWQCAGDTTSTALSEWPYQGACLIFALGVSIRSHGVPGHVAPSKSKWEPHSRNLKKPGLKDKAGASRGASP